MPIHYENREELYADPLRDLAAWHHEGIGEIRPLPGGRMRLSCLGSRQGAEGCMAFFRPTLPDQVAVEYTLTVLGHGGLVINYLAIRGLQGEDLIEDRDVLPPRAGIMANYWSEQWGLQSYHVSFSRFNDRGEHTQTSNWRRNPGCLLVGHGTDLVQELRRPYRIRVTKDAGHCQLFVDGQFDHGMVDHVPGPPDTGKFGFRLIGSEVEAEVADFHVYRIGPQDIWRPQEYREEVPAPARQVALAEVLEGDV
ncbi:MAG: DUF1961 family protein [Armatimonadota bacterium]